MSIRASRQKRQPSGNFCAAIDCSNSYGKCPGKSFFRFPKDPQRSRRWVVKCRRKDLLDKLPEYLYRNCFVCMDHFEERMFANDLKNRLYQHAIPTKFTFSIPLNKDAVDRAKRAWRRAHMNTATLGPQQCLAKGTTAMVKSSVKQSGHEPSMPISQNQAECLDVMSEENVHSTSPILGNLALSHIRALMPAGTPVFTVEMPPASTCTVKTMPVSALKTMPVSAVKTMPVTAVKTMPVSAVKTMPVSAVKTMPVSAVKTMPVSAVKTMPVSALKTMPVSAVKTMPVSAVKTMPVSAVKTMPVSAVKTMPVSAVKTMPVSAVKTMPVSAVKTMPMSAMKTMPLSAVKTMPVSAVKTMPVSTVKTMPVYMLKTTSLRMQINSPTTSTGQPQQWSAIETAASSNHNGKQRNLLFPVTPREEKLKQKLKTKMRQVRYLNSKLEKLREKQAVDKQKAVNKRAAVNKRLSVKEILKELRNHLPDICVGFISSQIKQFNKQKNGRRYDDEAKPLYLSIYLDSPEAYRSLAKFFCMPAKSTLLAWLKSSELCPESRTELPLTMESIAKSSDAAMDVNDVKIPGVEVDNLKDLGMCYVGDTLGQNELDHTIGSDLTPFLL